MTRPRLASILPAAALLFATAAHAESPALTDARGFDIAAGNNVLHVELVAPNAVHVQYRAAGAPPPGASVVIDPARKPAATPFGTLHREGDQVTLDSPQLHVRWDAASHELSIADAQQHVLLRQSHPDTLAEGKLAFSHDGGEVMYGIGGYNATEDVSAGLLRSGEQRATAGEQGHAGAPFVWSTAGYGILLDSVGAHFDLGDTRIDASMSTAHPDYYVFVGQPKALFGALTAVSGRSQLFPKWAMGFTNSQWSIDEQELLQIVDKYRAKHIPIDNFTLDFDWKDWGNDWGEFSWNTRKFPDGPSGKLKRMLDQRGIHLTGIMKPRVHIDTIEGREAADKGYFLAGNQPAKDYFSGKMIREIDFTNPQARTWFFEHMQAAFKSGMVGWWNDEADNVDIDTQHMDMQRAIYDGQRAISNQRVWSISRNFYLGAQRYAYGMWSGDIHTGFASMAGQRARMLSSVNVGAMQWGMDTGGFTKGTPTPENYARWIEFGAFVPIFRVHGDSGQKRQPWVYGPIAEKAATDAIRLRYALIPYIYSYENTRRETGVGLVRPLLFGWPNDAKVRNDVDSWMFGDYLLVSPVVKEGQTAKDIYLPSGQWTDWFSGKRYAGGQTIQLAIDATHWSDIPLFIRDGAIIPMQPPMDYVGEKPLTEVSVEVFPVDQRSSFDYYDDDGSSYDYEHGASFSQNLSVQRRDGTVRFETAAPGGSYTPATRFYLLKIHGDAAGKVTLDGKPLAAQASLDALRQHAGEAWADGSDRYGAVTWVRMSAGKAHTLLITGK